MGWLLVASELHRLGPLTPAGRWSRPGARVCGRPGLGDNSMGEGEGEGEDVGEWLLHGYRCTVLMRLKVECSASIS